MRITDKQTAYGITVLEGNPHWERFVEMLEADLKREHEGRDYDPDPNNGMIRTGRCQKVREILNAIKKAPEIYESLKGDK